MNKTGTIVSALIGTERGERHIDITIRVQAPKFNEAREKIDHAKEAESLLGKLVEMEVKRDG